MNSYHSNDETRCPECDYGFIKKQGDGWVCEECGWSSNHVQSEEDDEEY